MTRYKPDLVAPSDPRGMSEYLDRELNRIARSMYMGDGEWEDVKVSLTNARAATYSPGFTVFRNDGASSHGVNTWWFDPSSMEELFFDIQLPHSFWEKHGELHPHIHWSPGNSTNTGTVKWGLEFTVANIYDAFPTTTTFYAEQAADGVAYKHQLAPFVGSSGERIDSSDIEISSVILCRLFRDGANDSFTGDAAALSVDFHVLLNTRGSETEYQKVI